MPDGDMMVVTAVCPHSLNARPWVIASDDKVRIEPLTAAPVSLDGETRFNLKGGTGIIIKAAEHRAEIIKTSQTHFYDILRKKINP